MARCLIIACGCRGMSLAGELRSRGHVVRGTTRDPSRAREIEGGGVEAVIADPDRIATVAPALDHVGVVYVLLGSARAGDDQLAALHGPRLDMLLARILDSPVRGVVYEAAGSVDSRLLTEGAQRVRTFCEDARIPYAILGTDPAHRTAWLAEAAGAAERVLGGTGVAPG